MRLGMAYARRVAHGPRRKGLTLLELIVILVILAILSALAIPTFLSIIDKSKDASLRTTASSLTHDALARAAFTQLPITKPTVTVTGTKMTAVHATIAKGDLPGYAWGSTTGPVGRVTPATTTGEYTIYTKSTGLAVCLVSSGKPSQSGTITDGPCPGTGYLDASEMSAATGGCAIVSGHVWCWGSNYDGQLGDGKSGTANNSDVPVEVLKGAGPSSTGTYLSTVTQVSATYSACALTTSGHVWCWGENRDGQLGDGTTTGSDAPVEVLKGAESTAGTYLSTVTQVSVGTDGVCTLTSPKNVWCWGVDDGTTTRSDVPVEVLKGAGPSSTGTYLSTVTQVSAGTWTICALTTSGHVWCWGVGTYGAFGDGSLTTSDTPVETLKGAGPSSTGTYLSTVTKVTVGAYDACALTVYKNVWCWGKNYWGQLGDGTIGSGTTSDVPVEVVGPGDSGVFSTATRVTIGQSNACALTTASHVWCWGQNTTGQLGDGTIGSGTTSDVPVEVVGPGDSGVFSTVTTVSAAWASTCALTTASHVWCWGLDAYGQLGDGTTTNSDVPVEVRT